MRNKIQVFGLPRSGTNFVEWSLRNNFVGLDYVNIDVKSNLVGFKHFGRLQALKHNYPSLDYSDFVVVVWRDVDEWLKSVKSFRHTRGSKFSRGTLEEYLGEAKKISEDKRLIYNHRFLVNHYFDCLEEISLKFGVELVDNPVFPSKRLLTDGGVSMGSEEFVLS